MAPPSSFTPLGFLFFNKCCADVLDCTIEGEVISTCARTALHGRVHALQNEVDSLKQQHSSIVKLPHYELKKIRTGTPASYAEPRDRAFVRAPTPDCSALELRMLKAKCCESLAMRTPPTAAKDVFPADLNIALNTALNFGVDAIMVDEDGDSDTEDERDDLCTPNTSFYWLQHDDLRTPPRSNHSLCLQDPECSPDCPAHKPFKPVCASAVVGNLNALCRAQSMPASAKGKAKNLLPDESMVRRVQSQYIPQVLKSEAKENSAPVVNVKLLTVALPTSPADYQLHGGHATDSGEWEVALPVSPAHVSKTNNKSNNSNSSNSSCSGSGNDKQWVVHCTDATAM